MTQIRELFFKDIDRPINGVIKADTQKEEDVKYEMEEYVITSELTERFREFFTRYIDSLKNPTEDIGVWISGFFGSGKSHLLKMFGTLLGNKAIKGRLPLEYFKEKTDDKELLNYFEKIRSTNTISILFNIDAVGNKNIKQEKDNIAPILLKEFYGKLGFSKKFIKIATFERELWLEGKYEQFKQQFEEQVPGKKWEEYRDLMSLKYADFVKVATENGYLTEDEAISLAKSPNDSLSIEEFAGIVKKCSDHLGNDTRIIFLLDEIGQYIRDSEDLMLNLQTVSEKLGTVSKGKVWLLVTAQETMDNMVTETAMKRMEFSKIQGRFKTKLSLTSQNVDEVIQKRLLSKKDNYQNYLMNSYEENGIRIDNGIHFSEGTKSMEKFKTAEKFAEFYPLIPYQFDLLQTVFENIRKQGYRGKHMSEGERSMLTSIQDAVVNTMEKNIDILIPFSSFYKSVESFINPDIARTISKAKENANIETYDIEVLKTLFMLKDIVGFNLNIENITTVMLDKLDADKIALEKKVHQSLKNLSREHLVLENNGVYKFLTDEEQTINRYISEENIASSQITQKVMEKIFKKIYMTNQIKSKKLNNTFEFNKKFDDTFYGNQSSSLNLAFVSEESINHNDARLITLSAQDETLYVKLNDCKFLEEIEIILKINQYADKISFADLDAEKRKIIEGKREEARERERNIETSIEEAIINSNFFVGGEKIDVKKSNAKDKLNEGLEQLVCNIYSKNNYVVRHYDDSALKDLFERQAGLIKNDLYLTHENRLAFNDVKALIDSFNRVSLKELYDRFKGVPYGFSEDDIIGLIIEMVLASDIKVLLSEIKVEKTNLIKQLRAKASFNNTIIEKNKKTDEALLMKVKKIAKEFFGELIQHTEEDEIASDLKSRIQQEEFKINKNLFKFKNNSEFKYPGEEEFLEYKEMLNKLLEIKKNDLFFNSFVKQEENLQDAKDDFENANEFFHRGTDELFDSGVKMLKRVLNYSQLDSEIENNEYVVKLKEILTKNKNLRGFNEINILLEKIQEKIDTILDRWRNEIKEDLSVKESQFETVFKDKEFFSDAKSEYSRLISNLTNTDEEGLKFYSNKIKSAERNIFNIIGNNLSKKLQEVDKNIKASAEGKNITADIKSRLSTGKSELENKIRLINEFNEYDMILSMINNYEINSKYALDGVEYKKPEVRINPKLAYREIESIEEIDKYLEDLRNTMKSEILAGNKIIFS